MSDKKFKQWLRQIARSDAIAKRLERYYEETAKAMIRLGYTVDHDPEKFFSFDNYPIIRYHMNRLLKQLAKRVTIEIENGISEAWNQAELDTNQMVEELFLNLNNPKITKEVLAKFQARNLEGLKGYQFKKMDGYRLSDKIWNTCDLLREQMNFVIDEGFATGKSATQLSQDLRGYLHDPFRLHRRVRNRRGLLVESKAMAAFQPKRGVYKSAYKNAFRAARTSINNAYREADHQKWQELDFVVGMEVRRSNNPYPCPICEELKGKYPKDFHFPGWHPQCRCNIVAILASKEEMERFTEMILNDEDTADFKSKNDTRIMPRSYKDWEKKNFKRILSMPISSVPYFIRYNYIDGDISKGLRFAEK